MRACNYVWVMAAGAVVCVIMGGCHRGDSRPEEVKVILGNPLGYLQAEFSPATIDGDVATSLRTLDGSPVKFQKLVVDTTSDLDLQNNPTAKPKLGNRKTYLNAGGGLVESLEERAQNGIPQTQVYALSYRNFLFLRSQTVPLGHDRSNYPYEVRSIARADRFLPASAGKEPFEFDFESGLSDHGDGRSERLVCTWGALHPAAEVFVKFTGAARDLECTNFNRNGVLTAHSRRVFLFDYGIQLLTGVDDSSGKIVHKVTGFTVE